MNRVKYRWVTVIIIILVAVLMFTMTACSPSSSPDPDVTINLTASGSAFDKNTITVAPGAVVAIVFDNKDGVLHNFALYETPAATNSIFVGQLISNRQITYVFTAPSIPGTYFFRCDVHPLLMTGDFIVA